MVELNLDLFSSMRKIEDLTKKPWRISSLTSRAHMGIVRGQGKEVDGFIEYSSEMDSRYIDWIASARSNKIMIRKFVEERSVNCSVIMDVSSSMFYTSINKLKCEYAAEVANNIIFGSIATNDMARLIMNSDTIFYDSTYRSSHQHYFSCITALSKSENYGGIHSLQASIGGLIKEKAHGVMFIISDFLNYDPVEMELIKILKSKNDVIVIIVRDRMERYLPPNVNSVCIEDIHSHKSIIIDIEQVKEEYEEEMAKNEKLLQYELLRSDIPSLLMYTHEPYEQKLLNFFRVRGKSWS